MSYFSKIKILIFETKNNILNIINITFKLKITMESKVLNQEILEKLGEEAQMEMIITEAHELGIALQDYKIKKNKERFPAPFYSDIIESYNEVCEKIASMKIMLEWAEFLFNSNDIEKHKEILIQNIKNKLKE